MAALLRILYFGPASELGAREEIAKGEMKQINWRAKRGWGKENRFSTAFELATIVLCRPACPS